MYPAFAELILLGTLLLGLVLLAVGIVLLFRLPNKLAGALTTAVGAVFTFFPVIILLALITISVRG